MTPQQIIQQKKDKENPAIAAYRLIQQLGDQLKTQLDAEMKKIREENTAMIQEALKNVGVENKRTKIEVNGSEIASLQGPQGEKGDTPEKGKDYFTDEDVNTIRQGLLDQATPKKGVHYNDGAPGITPKKGVDYFTSDEIRQFLRQSTPIKGVHYHDGQPGKDARGRPGRDGANGSNGSPDTVGQVAKKFLLAVKNGLITLPDTQALADQLRKEINNIARSSRPAKMTHGGGMTLKAGAGQTLTRNSDGTWTLSGGSGGLSVITTASTIDGSNVNFVFASKPTLLVVNGTAYRENKGWSWNAGTLTATTNGAPGTSGDVYALA